MRTIITAVLITFLSLYGCTTMQGYPSRSDDPVRELQALATYLDPEVVTTYNSKPSTEKQAYRDDVVNGRIRAVDINFNAFEQALSKEGIGINVATDWAVIGLGGAGAIVGGASTKSILSATSGAITGAKGSIDKHVFFEKTMPVLLSQMEALRKEVLVRIRSGLELGVDKYPLMAALIDLEDYYKAGTVPGALMGITAASGDTIKKADEKLETIIRGTFTQDDAGDFILKTWNYGNSRDKTKKILECMKKEAVEPPDVDINTFSILGQYSAKRKGVVKCLME
jgi:hypothetical protein